MDWLGEWLSSPGFGGLAAVVAATIAYRGVRRTVQQQQEAARKQQWWDRARWALDLTQQDDNEVARLVGLEVLEALAESEYADQHEAEVISAAVAPLLDAFGDAEGLGDLSDEQPDEGAGPRPSDQAHLSDDEKGDS